MTFDFDAMLADREAGTDGDWHVVNDAVIVAGDDEYTNAIVAEVFSATDARRIARVPAMEAEIIRLSDVAVFNADVQDSIVERAKKTAEEWLEMKARAEKAEAERDAAYEHAAKSCDRIAGNTADFGRDVRRAAGMCAAAIRAMKETEHD